ncbi:hypothetical protein TNCV_4100991 [Trichonephila clavipes]|nr:hypothetical protein TNCV_4100991 [Trichonephila clavipes]
MSSNLKEGALKIHSVEGLLHVKSIETQKFFCWLVAEVRRGGASSCSSPIALVLLHIAFLIYTPSHSYCPTLWFYGYKLFIGYKQFLDNARFIDFSQRASTTHLIEDGIFNDSDNINNLTDYEDGQEEPNSLFESGKNV